MGKKAVYYINTDKDFGYVAFHVWEILQEEGYFTEKTGILFDGQEVMKHVDEAGDEFYFVPTHKAICLQYKDRLDEMNRYFADADISGMVTWHEGAMLWKKC